jgi:hypothetical protein
MGAPRKKKIISSSESLNQVVIKDGATVLTEAFAQSTTAPTVRQRIFTRWGIPNPLKADTPPEIVLLERIVFVKYRDNNYWWPAILYQNYTEALQQPRIWKNMNLWTKASLINLTLFNAQDKRNRSKVAWLLGRPNVEFVEVHSDDDYAEFYWQLPMVLPTAFDSNHFQTDAIDLYYDWHRAMDQVENLLQDLLGKHFSLLPGGATSHSNSSKSNNYDATGKRRTWLQQAKQTEKGKWVEQNPLLSTAFCNCSCVGPDDELVIREY